MRRPTLPTLVIAGLVMLCGASSALAQTAIPEAPAAAPAISPEGAYQRTEPAVGVLTLSPQGTDWRIEIVAGGPIRGPDGAGTPADCHLVAVGPLSGESIVGTLVPFEAENAELDASDIGADPGTITVAFGEDGATVSDENASSRLCGLGSDIGGLYTRPSEAAN